MPRLILQFKEKILSVHPLSNENSLTIGRQPDNTIVIDNLAVSGHHARVDYDGQALRLKDLNSKNGTLVNHRPAGEALLQHQDTIIIGKHTLLVDLHDNLPIDATAAGEGVHAYGAATIGGDKTMFLTPARAPQTGAQQASAPAQAHRLPADMLHFVFGGQGEFDLTKRPVFSIGRNRDADVVLGGFWALLAGAPSVTITRQSGNYFLRFAGGLLKPKRNGISIKGPVQLKHEDMIALGPVKMKIHLGGRSGN